MAYLLPNKLPEARFERLRESAPDILRLHQINPERTHPEVAKAKRWFRRNVYALQGGRLASSVEFFRYDIHNGTRDGKTSSDDVHMDFPSQKYLMSVSGERSVSTLHFPNWNYDPSIINPRTSELFTLEEYTLVQKQGLEQPTIDNMCGWFMADNAQISFLDVDDVHAAAPLYENEWKILFWAVLKADI